MLGGVLRAVRGDDRRCSGGRQKMFGEVVRAVQRGNDTYIRVKQEVG